MKRRILSAFLLVVMLISLMPAQAFAAEPTAADMSGTTMTVGGDSSFGSLLGNTVNAEQSRTGGDDFTASISELTVEGTKAVVEYSINAPATVVVAIYSDDGFTMLGSGTAEAQPDGTWVAVDIEIAKMPKYFTAGAFMLDPETNNPVSEEYKTTRYTKAYMDIKAATVDDFDPELVLNLDNDRTTNFAVFNENTILADAASGVTVTELGSGIYRIDNPNDSILAMQAGDRFAYTYADGTVLIVCAADVGTGVDEKGTYVRITEQADAELADVFDFVKIETDSFDKEVSYDESTLSEGVEMVDPAEIDQLYDAGTMGLGDRPLAEKKGSLSSEIGIKFNKKFENGSKLTGGIKCGFTATLEVFISINYQNVTFSIDTEVSEKIALTGTVKDETKLPSVDIEFLPGVSGYMHPKVVFEFSGSIDWTGKLKSSVKYIYDSETGASHSQSGPTLKSEVAVSGKLFIGIKFDIGIAVISEKILKFGMEAKVGAELSMKNKIDFISTVDTGRVHECTQCYEGELDKVLSLSVYLDILDGMIRPEYVLGEIKSKICDCYLSIDFQDFGFTKCPYISYKVSVQLLKGGKAVQACVPVELYHDGRLIDSVYVLNDDLKPVTSAVPETGDNGTSTFYLSDGKYTVAAELDGSRQEKEFTVSNNGKELKLVFPDDASDYPFTISESSLQMSKGDTKTLTASFNGKKVASSTIWSTSNAKVAEVRNGVVTAKNNGDAVISASYSVGGLTYSASCKVKVSKIASSGTCGDNLTWTLDDAGTLTISGTGKMYDHSIPWYGDRDKITKLVLNNGVTTIGNNVFEECTSLISVTIPDSVTTIGEYAFSGCTSLTSVAIPDSVTTIGDSAFNDCTALTSVTIGNGVTTIGDLAFGGCAVLASLTIGDSVTTIGECAFSGCTSLTTVTIPDSVTSIGYGAFWGCAGLTSVTIPDSVTTISGYMFFYCSALKSVTIPDSVTSIGYSAFGDCAALTSVTIPDNVTTIGDSAFEDCTGLTSVTIGSGVTTIGFRTFSECSALATVTIGSGVTTIEYRAFYGCTALSNVYYTGTYEQWKAISIGSENESLTGKNIHFNSSISIVIVSGKCGYDLIWTLDNTGTLTVSGTGNMNNYYSDSPWDAYKNEITKLIIGDDVTNIGSGAFSSCNNMTSVTIGSSVASIDNFAFNYCTGLTSVTIPDSVTVIGDSAFYGCTGLTSVTIPDSVTVIGSCAFGHCRNLTNVTLGNGVTSIGSGAFFDCGFTRITIPSSVTNIDGNVFSCCSSLTRIDVASANKNYSSIDGVLYSKDGTALIAYPEGRKGTFKIPDNVTSIGDSAFYGCFDLANVTIPDSVTTIGDLAFRFCKSLTDVYYIGTEEQWNAITIGEYNYELTNATIHFNSSAVTAFAKSEDEEEDEIPTEEEEEPLPEIEVEAEEELIIEELPIEEIPADEAFEEAPIESAPAAVEPVAAHKGTSGTKGKFRTAKFTNLEPGEEYVLIVSVDPTALLKPANLLYIAQDNAAADGTLTLSYIPRTETPSASVTLYGVPRDRKISLDREYLALQAGDTAAHLGAEVYPDEWSKYLTWRADNPDGKEVISVSASGDVTPLAVGTAYAVAEVSHKGYTFTARCRVDVSEKSIEEEIEISGVQLGTAALTSELYSRKYAEFDLLLLLPQNVSTMSAESADKPEDNGIAIKNARFADVSAQKLFDLVVTDDRRIAVVPKDSAVENAKTVKSSYTSAVIVTVGNTEFVTDAKLKLTVKKTMPKLKAETVQFNSFYSSQSAPIVISGAAVTAIRPDTAKKLAVPAWLTLTDGQLALNNAPQKSASGSVYVLAETEEWVVPAAVTVSVRNTYKAPKLKLSAASVTFSNTASGGTAMTLMPNAKNETLEQYNVADITAANGFTVEGFDAETGAFTLKAPEGYKSGKTTLAVSFGDTDTTVSLPLTVKTAAPTVKLKKTSVTLNPAHGDIAEIDMTVTPADYMGVLNVSVANASGTAVTELDTWLADGKLYVHTVDATKYNTTYKVSVSVPGTTGRPAVLTVRTSKENMKPSVTVKAAGAIDLTYPDSAVTVTPTFKNFNGGFTVTGGRVTETKGRTAISEGDLDTYFTVTQTGNTIRFEKAENAYLTAGNTYTAQLTLSIAGMELTASAKITVKATAVSLRLSKNALTLNKLVNDASSVAVTCTTKNYVLGEPVISVMDKTGKNSAEGKLDTAYSGGTLYVSVNEATEYGASYKVLVSAGEGHRAATLTVTVPTKAKSAVTATVRAAGSIDVLRGGSSITLTPTYRNALTTAYTERVEVYSSADGFRSPVDGVFAVDGCVLTNISADSALKYKVKVITTFENGYETASPLTAITVKAGSARMTVSGAAALYLKDANSRGSFTVASSDLTLNGVARAEIKDAKNAAMFELYDYGNGEFAIGFKDGRVSAAAAKLKSASVAINVWVEGAPAAKPTATVTLKLNIVK